MSNLLAGLLLIMNIAIISYVIAACSRAGWDMAGRYTKKAPHRQEKDSVKETKHE